MEDELLDVVFIEDDMIQDYKQLHQSLEDPTQINMQQLQSPPPSNFTTKPISQSILEKIVQNTFDEFTLQQEEVFNKIFERISKTESNLKIISQQSQQLEDENIILTEKINELVEGQVIIQIESYIGTISNLNQEIQNQLILVRQNNKQLEENVDSQCNSKLQLQILDKQLIEIIDKVKSIQNLE